MKSPSVRYINVVLMLLISCRNTRRHDEIIIAQQQLSKEDKDRAETKLYSSMVENLIQLRPQSSSSTFNVFWPLILKHWFLRSANLKTKISRTKHSQIDTTFLIAPSLSSCAVFVSSIDLPGSLFCSSSKIFHRRVSFRAQNVIGRLLTTQDRDHAGCSYKYVNLRMEGIKAG